MNDAVAQAQALIDHRLGLAPAGLGFPDHNVDIVLFESFEAAGEFGGAQVHELAVDARAAVTQTARAGNDFLVKTLTAAHDGTQHQDFFAAVGTADAVEDLAARQGMNLPAALHAMLLADLRIKQPQVVIDLRHRGHGGFFAALAEPLLDGDRRRDAGDIVDIGPRHDFKKLARIGREAVDVAALSFGVNDIEGEGRLSRAAETCKNHE